MDSISLAEFEMVLSELPASVSSVHGCMLLASGTFLVLACWLPDRSVFAIGMGSLLPAPAQAYRCDSYNL